MRDRLLEWYEQSRRDLPWRRNRNPYSIWVSEIMLQQTRVAVVVDRHQAFMARFPTLESLASAREDEVLALWSGLGYYRRARMLHKAAQFIVEHFEGNMPQTAEELRLLPGIGSYTAAAIASIAHNEQVAVVDGNVERVLCRMEGWDASSRVASGALLRRKIEELANKLVCPLRPGDSNQALMELGATLCLPRNPQCLVCPVAGDCKTQGEHRTAARKPMQSREVAYALSVRTGRQTNQSGRQVLLEQRPPSLTVMPGLWELPTLKEAAVPDDHLRLTLRHAIMQVNYYVRIRAVLEDDIDAIAVAGGERRWVPLDEVAGMALTGLTRKVLTRLRLLPDVPLNAATAEDSLLCTVD
ncbi:MAG: A/G-specific adenine glycosylase [Terracidiphilus sp.]